MSDHKSFTERDMRLEHAERELLESIRNILFKRDEAGNYSGDEYLLIRRPVQRKDGVMEFRPPSSVYMRARIQLWVVPMNSESFTNLCNYSGLNPNLAAWCNTKIHTADFRYFMDWASVEEMDAYMAENKVKSFDQQMKEDNEADKYGKD